MTRLDYTFKAIITLMMVGVVQVGTAQDTGPGGVGTSANNVIWLDANQLSLGDGAAVSTWSDASGNGNDFTQATAADQPTFNTSGAINSMPSVTFDGTSDFVESGAIAALDAQDEISFFTVTKSASSLSNGAYVCILNSETTLHPATWGFNLKRESGVVSSNECRARDNSSNNKIAASTFSTSNITNAMIVEAEWNSSDQVLCTTNGGSAASASGANASGFTHQNTTVGNIPWGKYFNGDICEVIVFDEDINTAQEKIILNYLSAKYNITLSGSSIYAHNSTHSVDVAGVGRDDASNEHLSAQGTGPVSMTVSGIDDGDFMIWGHDDGGYAVTSSNVPTGYSGNRFTQEWVVSQSGDLSDDNDVSFTIDITGNEFGDEADYQIIIDQDGDDDWTNADTITGTYLAGVVSVTVPAGDIIDGSKFTLGNKQETVISIIDGQNWNQTSTWSCSCVPTSANNVIIDLGHNVTISDAQSAADLDIDGTLTFDNGADLDIVGNVDCDGTVTMNSSSMITLSGTAAQTLDFSAAVTFDNLEMNNSNGALLNTGTFSFAGSLLPTDGTIDFNGNSVTFLSSASGTAAIGPITGGISGLTNVNSERYIEAGIAGWSEVGFPFDADFAISEWDDEIFMSGPTNFADGCAYDASGCFNSVTYWDAGTQANVGVDDANMNINQGVGIDIYLGDNTTTWSAKTLVTDGRSLNLTLSQGITVDPGWNFIANPFLCPVDWDLLTRASVDNYYWIYDAEDGWLYYDPAGATITNSASVNMSNGVISSYQGFWVFATGAGSITFDQNDKSVSSGDEFLKSSGFNGQSDYFTATLTMENSLLPPSRVYFDLSDNKSKKDIAGLPARYEHFSMYAMDDTGRDRTLIAVDAIDGCERIPLSVEGISNGDYSLSFDNLPGKVSVYLIDNLTGEVTEIEPGTEFDLNLTSEDEDRFVLLFSKSGIDCEEYAQEELNVQVASVVNGFVVHLDRPVSTYSVQVIDMLGKEVYRSGMISDQSVRSEHFGNFTNGSYILSIQDEKGSVLTTEKFIIVK